jgi:hypothetical protein
MSDPSAPPSSERTPSGAGIEVTPEMVEAGVEVLYTYDLMAPPGHDELCAAVTEVFRAMLRVQTEYRSEAWK